jgi:hypothetical protein
VPFPNPKAASCLHSSVPFQKAGRVPRPNHAVELLVKSRRFLPAAHRQRWSCITGPMPVLSMYGSGNSMAKENVL